MKLVYVVRFSIYLSIYLAANTSRNISANTAPGPPSGTHFTFPMGRRGALSCERRPAHAPHIVVLMLDDLGFADTGFGGSPVIRTPAIDALASRAVHLTAFRAPTWCAPSRASFLTGRHGWQLGILTSGRQPVLAAETALLPEVLRDLGYRTALVGKFHGSVRSCRTTHRSGGPFGCGFDQQYGFVGGMSDYWEHHSSWSRDGALGKCMVLGICTCTVHAWYMPSRSMAIDGQVCGCARRVT